LQQLTLYGYRFNDSYGENSRVDCIWPEFPQLTTLNFENCVFDGEDLTQILPRTNAKLKSLGLFATRYPFSNSELPSYLADSLEELWIEDCWPLSFESFFDSYTSLRSLHVDWDIFSKAAPFPPRTLLNISVAVPRHVADSAPDYDRFQALLGRLSIDLPLLQIIRVSGEYGYPLLSDAKELQTRLGLEDVRLVVDFVRRTQSEFSLAVPQPAHR
jgi:hypothetical protein